VRRLLIVVLLVAALGAVIGVAHLATPLFGASGAPSWYAKAVYPLDHAAAIRSSSRRNRLDPALVAAVIYAESRFDEQARSSQGAVGLMQVLPETAAQIARETGGVAFTTADLEDPAVNVRYGCYYLRRALAAFDGDAVAAVASYNAGMGAVADWRAAAAAEGHELRIGDIPYPETRAYVRTVLRARRVYGEMYGDRLSMPAEPG
jgi:soluble lytic murein transglycosylase